MMRFVVCLALLFALPAYAEPSKNDLKKIEQNLQSEQQKQAELKQQEDTIDQQLGSTKQKLVQSASRVQSLEQQLNTLENQLTDLDAQETVQEKAIARKRKHLSQMTAAWLRLARTPPELMLFAPLPPSQIVQAGAVFHHVVPLLYSEAQKAKADLDNLHALQDQVRDKQASADALKTSLTSSQEELSGLLDQQQEQKSAATAARTAQEKRVTELAAQAADLRDLLDRLEKEKAARKVARKAPSHSKGGLNPNLLPVAGTVTRSYGDKDDVGMISRGVSITARSGATVTAPFDGEVQYAGPFRSYGNIVILTRDDGVHALLAGFQKIQSRVGDQVGKGEPLGTLPAKDKPTLYIEYRQGTEPIDPSALNLSDSVAHKPSAL